MEADWIDRVVGRLSALHPGLPMTSYQVTGRIARIAARIAQRQEETFGRFGLNRGEMGVLSTLRTAGPPHALSPTQLFRGLMLSSAGMTKRLDRLEKRGLVERSPDPADRRGIVVELTEAGGELADTVIAANTGDEEAVVAALGARDRQVLEKLLRKVLSSLEPPGG